MKHLLLLTIALGLTNPAIHAQVQLDRLEGKSK
jgi:hypothetical protein